ncbi:putative disease resistance protein At1g50180 [Mangifera indica]|uniref:putative disease resistance protein At1g50180 n=1 Tax=Mangifera indica TaxID=29780 RepID=UPI001CF93081|nr:putative disease resistance protein At1g50180 [Mangifera indica]
MAEALVSGVFKQLTAVVGEGIQQKVRLVVDVDEEVKQLSSNLDAIQAVLVDAEARQVTETAVRRWLDQLKHASYDIEDVLDEWNYAILKQKLEGVEDATDPMKKSMREWEEWDYEITRIGEEEEVITIMPSLVSFTIFECPKLKALPKHLDQNTRLEKVVYGCPLLG